MPSRILIIGFQRGGTTLTRRIFHFHPDVLGILHEDRVLNKTTNVSKYIDKIRAKEWNDLEPNRDLNGWVWGEKVPWSSNTGSDIISYANRWLRLFGKNARIVHVLRHPVDVGLSNAKRGWLPLDSGIKGVMQSTPRVINALNGPNYKGVVFEDLLKYPEDTLSDLFRFCNIDNSDLVISNIIKPSTKKFRYFDGIDASRAFAYKKKKNLSCEIPDYNKLTRLIK